jgi:hypothetical protein
MVIALPVGLTIVGMALLLGGAAYMLAEGTLGSRQVYEEIAFGLTVLPPRENAAPRRAA